MYVPSSIDIKSLLAMGANVAEVLFKRYKNKLKIIQFQI